MFANQKEHIYGIKICANKQLMSGCLWKETARVEQKQKLCT